MSLHDLFQKYDDEYLKFDRIPEADRLHPSRLICGYLKLASLMKEPASFDVHAEHDEVFLCHEDDLRDPTEDDVIYLRRCGIRYCGEYDCLGHFC